jgi:hypothetical protein
VQLSVSSLGSRMPAGKERLPYYTDRPGPWRHPVHAHGPRSEWVWVSQRSGAPHWFERVGTAGGDDAKRAFEQAMEDVRRWVQ